MITEKENLVLNAIPSDCFMDGLTGRDAVDKMIWADTGCDHIASVTKLPRPSLGGIIASLSKKGLLNYYPDGRDSCYSLTTSGAAQIWPEVFGGPFPIMEG